MGHRDTGESTWEAPPDDLWSDAPVVLASSSDLASGVDLPSSSDLPDGMDLPGAMPSAPNLSVRKSIMEDRKSPVLQKSPSLKAKDERLSQLWPSPSIPRAMRTSIMKDRKSALFDARDLAGADAESDGVVAGPVCYRYFDEGYQSYYFINRDTGESTWDAPPDDLWSDGPRHTGRVSAGVAGTHLMEC